MRGFDLTYNGIFRDGLRQIGSSLTLPRIEPYGLEAATILRGPASGLFGLGSPGGIVDATTKRPLFTPFGEVQFQGGNYNRFRAISIWAARRGKRRHDGLPDHRHPAAGRHLPTRRHRRPNLHRSRFYLEALSRYHSDVLGEYQENKVPGNPAFFNENGRITRLYSGDPALTDFKQRQGRIGYAFEHRFSPDLVFRQNARYYGVANSYAYVQINSLNDARTLANRGTGF